MTLAAICLVDLLVSSASAQTGAEMLRACQFLQRGMHVEGTRVFLPPSTDARVCWGFVEAVQQYSTLADQDGKTWLHACPPEHATTTQVLQVFVAYMQAHPEKLNLSAAAVAYNAMADAFPCK